MFYQWFKRRIESITDIITNSMSDVRFLLIMVEIERLHYGTLDQHESGIDNYCPSAIPELLRTHEYDASPWKS